MSTSWISGLGLSGGLAGNGVLYGAAEEGTAWGTARCPLLPRSYRAEYGSMEAPLPVKRLFDASQLTIAELGAEIWDRCNMVELPRWARSIQNHLTQLRIPHIKEVIPARLSLSWVTKLPLRTRTRNTVRRLIEKRGTDAPLEKPISSDELLMLHSAGRFTLIDLLCVLESAERYIPDQKLSQTDEVPISTNRAIEPPGEHYLKNFAAWAMAETDSITIGDAVLSIVRESRNVVAWRELAQLQLEHVTEQPSHPYDVLDEWINQLPDREQRIFRCRIAKHLDARTLQELADDFEITRERVRQIENRVRKKLTAFVEGATGQSIRWRMGTLRKKLGNAAPMDISKTLLAPVEGQVNYGSLLLELAGPYDSANGWYVLRAVAATDPIRSIRGKADEFGRINRDQAAAELSEWGLDSSLHETWLTRDGKIRSINGHFVRWDGPIGDKLAFALNDLGRPATVQALLSYIQEDRTAGTAKNAISADPRFVRASRTEWALASWGLPEYSGVASSIRRLLEREGEPMRVEEIVERLRKDFGIAEVSARSYCDAVMFEVRDGWIRLRSDHEPYQYDDNTSVHDSPGVFVLGPCRLSLLFEADGNILRGSGRQLSHVAGVILNIAVNDRLTFQTRNGVAVTVTFPETSFIGPSLGSTRTLAEAVGAKLGDQLTLILDRSDMSVTARATKVTQHETGWELVARLTGIEPDTRMDGLADSLNCERGNVRSVLRARGDKVVIEALPVQSMSSELEYALATLDAEMRRDENRPT